MVGRLVSVAMAHGTPITVIHAAPSGDLVTGDGRGWLAGWDRFGCAWRVRAHRRGVSALATIPGCFDRNEDDGARCPAHLVSGGFDGVVALIHADGEVRIDRIRSFRRGISAVDVGATGDVAAAATFRGDLWCGTISGREIQHRRARFGERGPAFLRFSDDMGVLFVWGGRGRVELYHPESLAIEREIAVPELMTFDIHAHGTGTVVTLGYDHTIRHYLLDPWVELGAVELPFHGRGEIIGCENGSIWVRGGEMICEVGLQELRVLREVVMPGLSAAAFSAETGILAVGYRSGEMQIWQVREPTVTKN